MKHTEATKHKLSMMRRGKNNPFWGRKHTRAVRRAMALRIRIFNSNRTYDLIPSKVRIPSGIDRGYLAGLIDGEGSIRFRKGSPFVAIYNSDSQMKRWLEKKTGIKARWSDYRGRVPGWTWNIQAAADVYKVCLELSPLLIAKRRDCGNALAHLIRKYGARVRGAAYG